MTVPLCSIPGCDKSSFGRGWCQMHYTRWRRTGDPTATNRPQRQACQVGGCDNHAVARGRCYKHLVTGRGDIEISYQEAIERFEYDRFTGELRYRQRPRSSFASEAEYKKHLPSVGSVAGTIHKQHGYRRIHVDYKHVMAHRIAWLISFGELPPNHLQIDHINGRPSDNRIENLRLVTNAGNQRNAGIPVHNRSGVKGVYFESERQKWIAKISAGGKEQYLGIFNSLSDASACRRKAEREYGYTRTDEPSFARRRDVA